MEFTDSQLIIHLFNNIDVFLAVFARMIGFFIVVPALSSTNMPPQTRIALALGVAIIAFVGNIVQLPPYNPSLASFGVLLIQEFAIGLVIALVVNIMFTMFHFVGQLVDFQMGFGMVNVFDPFTNTQTPITGNFYFLIISLLFVLTGSLQTVLGLMFGSFYHIGLGQGYVFGNASLAAEFVDIIIHYFYLGFRIAMPAIGTIMIVNIILGIMVKSVPQMNVFVVGMPIKVLIGLTLMFLTMPFLISAFEMVLVFIVESVARVIGGMAGG